MLFYYFFTIAWFLVAALNYLEFCYVWQVKEYRLDRFGDYLSTRQGKSFIRSYGVLGKFLILLALIGLRWFDQVIPLSIFSLVLCFELFMYFRKYKSGRLKYPKLTIKTILIVAVALVSEMAIWLWAQSLMLIFAVFGLRFIFLSLVVWLFSMPTDLFKNYYIYRATEKLKRYQLKVIGVTGSYGKTTVKYFLAQFLAAKFKVVFTPKNINTEIGVAKFILKTDFTDQEIFIVEMGAYKMNEIKMICDMVNPEIGILTAINEQHLSLFGSIENIQSAKYELLFSLPAKGLAVTNSDNQYCREWLPKLSCQVETFGRYAEFKPKLLISKLQADMRGISFEAGPLQISSTVIGEHNAFNIAACVLVAQYLGLSNQLILETAKGLVLPPSTLQALNYGKCKILDDSYNANPAGFAAALKVLGSYPAEYKKLVVTRGMLELGEKSDELHQQIGRQVSEYASELILIAAENQSAFIHGAGKNFPVKLITKPLEVVAYLKSIKETKTAVLLENKMPIELHEEIKKYVHQA